MSMPEPFVVRIITDEPTPVVELTGELDMAVSESTWQTVKPLVDGAGTELVLDVAGLTFIDSRGLSVLARMLEALDGGPLRVRGASDRVRHLFEVSGLDDYLVLE